MARKQVEAKVTSSNDGQTSSSDAKSIVLEQTTSKAAGFLWASKDFLVLKRCANNAETRSNGPRQCQPQCGRLRTFKSCSNTAQAESKPTNYPFGIWATRTWKPIWFNWAPCPIALHTFPKKSQFPSASFYMFEQLQPATLQIWGVSRISGMHLHIW